MNKQEIQEFVNTNNKLIDMSKEIIKLMIVKANEVIKEYEFIYGKDILKWSDISNLENPFNYSDYIMLLSKTCEDGKMNFDGENVTVAGYKEDYNFGTELSYSKIPLILFEKFEQKEELHKEISKIINKIAEDFYLKVKAQNEAEEKSKVKREKKKKEKQYKLYLKLKEQYENVE